jgi:hypothetical protein
MIFFFEVLGVIILLLSVIYFIWQMFLLLRKNFKTFALKDFSKGVLLYLYGALLIAGIMLLFGFFINLIGIEYFIITALILIILIVISYGK